MTCEWLGQLPHYDALWQLSMRFAGTPNLIVHGYSRVSHDTQSADESEAQMIAYMLLLFKDHAGDRG